MVSPLAPLKAHWGDLASLGSALSWSFAVIFFQKAGLKMRSVPLNIFKNNLAIVMIAITIAASGQNWWPELSRRQWETVAASGILGITLGDLFLIISIRRVGAGFQAILDCAYSPIILLLAFLLFGEVLPPLALIGGAIVLSAIWVGCRKAPTAGDRRSLFTGIFFGTLTHVATGLAILIVKPLFGSLSILWLTGARFIIGQGVLVTATGLTRPAELRRAFSWKHTSPWVIAATFFGPYLALLLWMAGFKYTLAGRAAIFNQMSTVFTILLTMILLKEKLSKNRLAAVVLGIIGALLVGAS